MPSSRSARPSPDSTPRPARVARVDPGELVAGSPDLWRAGADLDGLDFAHHDAPVIDLAAATVRSCRFADVSAREAAWRSTRFTETVLERVAVPVVRAPRAVWRDVRIEGARLGSVEAYESSWRSVHVVGCKLDFVNLRAAELLDVIFTDCVIDELDLSRATARRVELQGTRVAQLDVQGATLEDVDLRGAELSRVVGLEGLRGAVISGDQLTRLAPLLAQERGIVVLDEPERR